MDDPEQMDAPAETPRSSGRELALCLLTVVVVAAGFRFWAIDFGDPCAGCRPDEEIVLRECLRLLQDAPHVHFFHYPPGMMILESLWIRGWQTMGWLPHIDTYADDPMPFHRSVRYLSALFGVATVLLSSLLARRLAGPAAGWVAGFALAVLPLHMLHSHFATLDVPGAFFMMLCLWLATGDRGRPACAWRLLAAAFAAGIAAGIKYPFGAVGLVPALMMMFERERHRWVPALAIVGLCGFLLASPTFLFQMEEAVEGIRKEAGAQEFSRGRWSGEAPWLYHLKRSLGQGSGMTILLAAGLGVIWAAMRRPRALLLLIPALMLYGVHSWKGNVFVRYMVPVVPIVAVFAALPFGLEVVRRRRAVVAALAAVVIAWPAWTSVRILDVLEEKDSRAELIEAFRAGDLPRDLPVFVPFYPFPLAIPNAWRVREMNVFASTYRSEVCTTRVRIDRESARRILGDEARAAGRVDVRIFNISREEASWRRQQKEMSGKEALLIIPRTFAGHHRWHEDQLAKIRAGAAEGWRAELLLSIDPLDGGAFPERAAYDPHDYWFIPFEDLGSIRRPGPKIEVWRVRFPESND